MNFERLILSTFLEILFLAYKTKNTIPRNTNDDNIHVKMTLSSAVKFTFEKNNTLGNEKISPKENNEYL